VPGASSGVTNGVKDSLIAAGATVSATVKVSKNWMDPTQEPIIGDLANRLAEPGISVSEGNAHERAGRVLANALLRHPPAATSVGGSALTTADASALAGFKTAGLVSVSPSRPEPGTMAVLVVGNAPKQRTDAVKTADATVTALARELDSAGGGVVVVGPPSAAEPGGVLEAARQDDDTRKAVSTVDDADTKTGRIRVVLALAAELRNESGQYGVGPGASAALPSPAPLPSP
jgi:hypothetical protein